MVGKIRFERTQVSRPIVLQTTAAHRLCRLPTTEVWLPPSIKVLFRLSMIYREGLDSYA